MFARTRNNSESARTPQNFDRKRQLSESQTETMNNSDSRINPRQLGTPRGGAYAAVPTSGDRKNLNKPTRGRKKSIFEAYMSKEDVSAGLKRGELIQVPEMYTVHALVISLWKSQAVVGNQQQLMTGN